VFLSTRSFKKKKNLKRYFYLNNLQASFFVEEHLHALTLSENCELPPQVQKLLKEFGNVFSKEEPIGLPPVRGIEHQIDLVSRDRINPMYKYVGL